MKTSHYLMAVLSLLLITSGAMAQKTAFGYTMYPSTSPSMISFDIDELSTTTRMGTFDRAEPRSGALVGNTLYMMGVDDNFYVWFYSMDINSGESTTIKRLGDATTPADMSYDYTTNTMYFIANSEETDGVSAIGTINMDNGSQTFIHDMDYYCKALAIDSRGQMYAMTSSGDLLKVNKSNGQSSVIGSTGIGFATWMGFHSMEFDRNTGTLYFAAWTVSEKSELYTIDPATGHATSLGIIGDGSHTVALGIPYAPVDGSAPDRVSDVILVASKSGALSGTLQWTNPLNDYNGNVLEGTISIEIVNNVTGEKTVIDDCLPGETMQQSVTVPEAGMYEYAIIAVNDAGASIEQLVEAWIGHDVPGTPANAKAQLNATDLLVNDLSWEAPVTGAHGGYIDATSLRYDIVRQNDGKTIAQNLRKTTFSDVDLLADLTRYSYQIIPKNSDGTGEAAQTNDIVNGPAVDCPYVAPFNSWEESGQYWTVLDGNGDGYPFVWYKDFMNMFGQGYDKCFYIYQTNEVYYGYDFIISPPINFTEGHEYKVTATVSNDDIAGYREESFLFYTLAGYSLDGATPLGNESFTVMHPGEFRDYSLTFTVEDDGYGTADETFPSFIALCCNSHYDMGMLLVSKISIEDLTAQQQTLLGDVNSDGKVDVADVALLIQAVLQDTALDMTVADVNGDTKIDVADVAQLITIVLTTP